MIKKRFYLIAAVLVLLCGMLIGCAPQAGDRGEDAVCEHEWQDATCTQPKTCIHCGLTEGDPRGHSVRIGTCPVCGEKSTELLPAYNHIMSELNSMVDAFTKSAEYLSDSYDFVTDLYQKEYVSKARTELYSCKRLIDRAIAFCADYEEFSEVKNKLNQLSAIIMDEKIMGEGSYKDIRSEMMNAHTKSLAILQNVLSDMQNLLA